MTQLVSVRIRIAILVPLVVFIGFLVLVLGNRIMPESPSGLTGTSHPVCGMWQLLDQAKPGIGVADEGFTDVRGFSETDVWAIGNRQGLLERWTTFITHWDGKTWDDAFLPASNDRDDLLYAISGAAADNLWAVGSSGDNTLIVRRAGKAWQRVFSPNAGPRDNILKDVAVVSDNDAWAVGSVGNYQGSNSTPRTLILHWNGRVWRLVPSPNPDPRENSLRSVAAISSNDAWAVGNYGLILHWDGNVWTPVAGAAPFSTPAALQTTDLYSVAALDASDVWIVGETRSKQTKEAFVEHWDGTNWRVVPRPHVGVNETLLQLTAADKNDVWAVGIADGIALVEHWDGVTWNTLPTSPNIDKASLRAVATSRKLVWAAGSYDERALLMTYRLCNASP